MSTTTVQPSDVTDVAPEFAGVQDDTIQEFIDIAALIVGPAWGKKRDKGIAVLAAHFLKDMGYGGGGNGSSSASGPVTMEKVGDLQKSYGTVALSGGSASDQLLTMTKYGRMFLMIKKTVFTSPLVV